MILNFPLLSSDGLTAIYGILSFSRQGQTDECKPALARGELQCIGATTFDEYRKYIEHDAALDVKLDRAGARIHSVGV